MAYVGGSLRSLFNEAQRHAMRDAQKSIATHTAGEWLKATRTFTPIDTGELKLSWYQLPTKFSPEGYTSGIGNNVDYAAHVEYGTGLYGPKAARYPITPKRPGGVLRWYDPKTGKPMFARKVMHPGSPGAHMVSKGASAAEAAMQGMLRPIMAEWEAKFRRIAD